MKIGILISFIIVMFSALSGCSSIDTSQRLTLSMPAKSNPIGTDTSAKYLWIDKPYITPIYRGLETLPMKGKFVRLNMDSGLCGQSVQQTNITDDDAADVLIDAKWLQFGKDKLINILNGLQETVHVPSVKTISQPATQLTAGHVVAGAIVAPIYIAAGVVLAPLYVLTGEAFKDHEPRDIEKRKSFVSKRIIVSDDTVTYALLKVQITHRREQLLFPVSTPSRPEDWETQLDYVLLFAIDASDSEQGRMALCGIPAKKELLPFKVE
jgi:hypothetical protein